MWSGITPLKWSKATTRPSQKVQGDVANPWGYPLLKMEHRNSWFTMIYPARSWWFSIAMLFTRGYAFFWLVQGCCFFMELRDVKKNPDLSRSLIFGVGENSQNHQAQSAFLNIKKGLSLSWAMWVNPSGPPSTTVRLSAPLRPKSLSKSIKSYFSGWLNQMLWVLLVKLPFWRIKMSQFCWSYPFNSAQIWNLLTG